MRLERDAPWLGRPTRERHPPMQIPFQLHRRIPLLRRPFEQRDAALAENAKLRARLGGKHVDRTSDLKEAYTAQVVRTNSHLPTDEGMSDAIGGDFDYVGRAEVAALKRFGLQPHHRLIDVGCGSGRLAVPLSTYLKGPYSGFDIVEDLIVHARKVVKRPDWRFDTVDHIGIPEPDGCADMVCFFSVLTHLLHEQSYWYLEEAKRVTKPGGTIVVSFLEFAASGHWHIFEKLIAHAKNPDHLDPLSVFIERNVLTTWAKHLGLEIVTIHDGDAPIEPDLYMGQSLCILRVPDA